MKLAVYSDLHTEFDHESKIWMPPEQNVDVMVFAGDIGTAPVHLELYARLVEAAHPRVKRFIYVAGNHEWYASGVRFGDRGYEKYRSEFDQLPRSTFLEMDATELEGITFLGCTLWSNLADTNAADLRTRLSDFSKIRLDEPPYRKLRASDVTARWQRSVRFLERARPQYDPRKTVVITHHSPTRKDVEAPHGDEQILAAYASDLDQMIEDWQPALWIHGHVHQMLDRKIGRTRIVCNPRGYNTLGGRDLVPDFDPYFTMQNVPAN